MDEKSVKENLRRAREECGLSQTAVAEHLGMNRSSFVKLESGSTRIVNKHFLMLAKLYGRSPEELMFGRNSEDSAGMLLQSENSFKEQKKQIINDYESRLEEKNQRLEALERLLTAKEDSIRLLSEIKIRLEKELDKLQKNQ